ncbi:MAG: hypothetical protein QF570_17120 [Myxococcota bacterium]|jgi:hypothetical protein|nr:hypothetical protein [Myxococcota bacterium]
MSDVRDRDDDQPAGANDASELEQAPEADRGLRKMLIAAALVAGIGVAALLIAIWFAGEPAPLPFDYDGFD